MWLTVLFLRELRSVPIAVTRYFVNLIVFPDPKYPFELLLERLDLVAPGLPVRFWFGIFTDYEFAALCDRPLKETKAAGKALRTRLAMIALGHCR